MTYDQIAILIPAYKPDERLIKLVDDLREAGFTRIVAVDDGGGAQYRHFFEAIEGKADVLVHEVNRGKGAALKTGIAHIAAQWPDTGVITVDADGQHTPEDARKIADALISQPDALILGSRDKKQMPPRSKVGNTLTCVIFAMLTGLHISDTQTGLRGLPAASLARFSQLDGDRYEYEINMLIEASRLKIPVTEVTIETIYIDGNASSHFNAIKDGLRIYGLMFRQAGKFMLSSLGCWLLEYILFIVLGRTTALSQSVRQVIVRVISSTCNYTINSLFVFEAKPNGKSFLKYCILAACILGLSVVGLKLLTTLGVPEALAKPIVDVILYLVSYRVQRSRVFAPDRAN